VKGDVIYTKRTITKTERELIKKMYPFGPLVNIITHYRHYGIDVGDGSVVHFSGKNLLLSNTDACVRHVSLEEFLDGWKKGVDTIVKSKYDRETVVGRALSKIGIDFGGYNFLRNNCEHFAYWCATGKRISRQVIFKNDDINVVEKVIENIFEKFLKLESGITFCKKKLYYPKKKV